MSQGPELEREDLSYDNRNGIYIKLNPDLDNAIRIGGTETFGRKRGFLKETLKEALIVWLEIYPHRAALLRSVNATETEHDENGRPVRVFRPDQIATIVRTAINQYLNNPPIRQEDGGRRGGE